VRERVVRGVGGKGRTIRNIRLKKINCYKNKEIKKVSAAGSGGCAAEPAGLKGRERPLKKCRAKSELGEFIVDRDRAPE